MAQTITPRTEAIIAIIGSVATAAIVAYFAGQQSHVLWGTSVLMWCAGLAMVIQWVAYVPAYLMQNERFYDLVGGLTYLTVVAFASLFGHGDNPFEPRQAVMAILVGIWATRLATFLARRVHKAGGDGRFDTLKISPLRFCMAWTMQGLWVFLTVLPVLVILTAPQAPTPIGIIEIIGWTLWIVGFGIEVVADRQKSAFKANPAHADRWIDQGLWAYSQHPNYFGEILLWTGMFISGIGVYEGTQWLAALSPVFVYLLLTRVSGITMLDVRAEARWGHDPAYRTYFETTNVLIPGPKGSVVRPPS